MRDETTMTDAGSSANLAAGQREEELTTLMIAWAAFEPGRVGEVALFEAEGAALILGRGGAGEVGRVVFHRQRPGLVEARPPLGSPGISREQLRIRLSKGSLVVEQIGRCALVVKGERVERATIAPGDTLLLKGQLLLFCTRRPRKLPLLRNASLADAPPFGAPDVHGIVGESPAAWLLRDQIAWLAQADQHTLILGGSGSGKELAARAIHALSGRAKGSFVARNAATIPAGIADAELFGNVKGYPNPGMPERPGLVGAAHGGTLFLDEIGELPAAIQANLLRVLDEGGEHHALGASIAKRSNFRLIGATNREVSELKHDLAARLVLRLAMPGLDARREDIPLLARQLLKRAAVRSPDAMKRFVVPGADGAPEPRFKASLVAHLLKCRFTTNVRELDAILWLAMSASTGDMIEWREAGTVQSAPSQPPPVDEPSGVTEVEVPEPSAEEIRASLAANGGNIVRAAQALGLSSRYALYRLMRKHGIEAGEARGG